MLSDSERLSRLINNILDFEKLARGKSKLDLQSNFLNKTITKVVKSLTSAASKKEISIIQNSVYPVKFIYDEDRMIQVFTNLISNAIKFCNPKEGIITIDYKLGNQEIEISVKDNGKGFEEEDIDFVFDKFYQSKNQNRIKPEGSGLGLAISKQIVLGHQGQIFINKKYKKGAEIIIKMPFHE